MKQTYFIYVIFFNWRLKTRIQFNYASCRANIYENNYSEGDTIPGPI
jgi:hypothetical protein